MAYESSVHFDSIVVVESLDDEGATGTALFNATIAPQCRRTDTYAELYHVASARELLGALRAVANLAHAGRSPIVHLEMHGSEHGLALRNGDEVSWQDLAPALCAINEQTRVNLLVVAAACHGWHLSDILRPTDRAPVWGVIGPPKATTAGNLRDALENFYSTLLTLLDLTAAMRAMNGGVSYADWSYRLQSADLLYCEVFRHYLTTMREEETQAERVNRLVADIARIQGLDVNQTMIKRQEIAADIENDDFWYSMYKTRFLMLDKFPENARRFTLELKDCAREAV